MATIRWEYHSQYGPVTMPATWTSSNKTPRMRSTTGIPSLLTNLRDSPDLVSSSKMLAPGLTCGRSRWKVLDAFTHSYIWAQPLMHKISSWQTLRMPSRPQLISHRQSAATMMYCSLLDSQVNFVFRISDMLLFGDILLSIGHLAGYNNEIITNPLLLRGHFLQNLRCGKQPGWSTPLQWPWWCLLTEERADAVGRYGVLVQDTFNRLTGEANLRSDNFIICRNSF